MDETSAVRRSALALAITTTLTTARSAAAQAPSSNEAAASRWSTHPFAYPLDEQPALPPLALPREGKGAIVFGSVLALGGVTATSLGVAAFAEGSSAWGIGGVAVGLPALGAGLGVTLLGVRRHRAYREWLGTTSLRPPRSGNAMLGAGAGTMLTGASVLAASGLLYATQGEATPGVRAGLALGGLAFAAGGVLLTIGSVRNGRWNAWRRGAVLPTASFGPQGVSLGLAGRF